MRTIRIPSADEIYTPEDLIRFLHDVHVAESRIAIEAGKLGLVASAMFKREDKIEGINRRAMVTRAILALSVGAIGAARFAKVANLRVRTQYPHYFGARRTTRRRPSAEWRRSAA